MTKVILVALLLGLHLLLLLSKLKSLILFLINPTIWYIRLCNIASWYLSWITANILLLHFTFSRRTICIFLHFFAELLTVPLIGLWYFPGYSRTLRLLKNSHLGHKPTDCSFYVQVSHVLKTFTDVTGFFSILFSSVGDEKSQLRNVESLGKIEVFLNIFSISMFIQVYYLFLAAYVALKIADIFVLLT